jgi:hypothetical protein
MYGRIHAWERGCHSIGVAENTRTCLQALVTIRGQRSSARGGSRRPGANAPLRANREITNSACKSTPFKVGV